MSQYSVVEICSQQYHIQLQAVTTAKVGQTDTQLQHHNLGKRNFYYNITVRKGVKRCFYFHLIIILLRLAVVYRCPTLAMSSEKDHDIRIMNT